MYQDHLVHFDFANALNLVSTVTLIGALVFTACRCARPIAHAANKQR
jgi:hypothetical protein